MSKVWKVGIAVLVTLLIAMATASAATTVSVTDDTVVYGDPVEVKVVNDGSNGTLTLKVKNEGTKDTEVLEVITTSGIFTYTYDTDAKGWYPGVYNLTLEMSNGTVVSSVEFQVTSDEPYIVLSIDDNTVAKGDALAYSLDVYWNNLIDEVWVNVTGPMNGTYQVDWSNSVKSYYWTPTSTTVNTSELLGAPYNGTTGAYTLKVKVVNTSVTSTASFVFYVEDISLTINPASTSVARGGSVDVEVQTNVADTGSDMDINGNNLVTWKLYNTSDKEVDNGTATIKDGVATFTVSPKLEWESGTYKLEVLVNTTSGYNASDSVDLEVTDPELTLSPSYATVVRGDSITIEGTTSLPAGTQFNVTVDPSDGGVSVSADRVYADAEGKFSFDVSVASDADLKTFTIKVSNDEASVEATAQIKVVRQGITVSTDTASVLIGGSLDVTIDTTAGKVFVYASKGGVFTVGGDAINKIPSLTTKINTTEYPTYNTSDDQITIDVDDNAQLGTYTLYFFAPENESLIDPIKDPQDVLYVTIIDISFKEVPSEVTLVKGGSATVTITVDTPKAGFANISATFSGNGVYTDLWDAGLVKDDTDAGTGEAGVFEITLYGKVNNQTLEMSEDGTKMLATGTYTLKVSLMRGTTVVDTKTIVVNVVNPQIEVTVPDQVLKGDEITVTISSNRAEDYTGFYVFLETPNQVYVQNPITDANGTAVAIFQTYGLDYGTYKIYVRDTMTTGTNNDDLQKFYNLDPADSTAKQIGFADDILFGPFEVSVVKELAPTPTPTPEETPTPTPTPTATPTPTPTKTPTPTPTPVETKEETPTPAPTKTTEEKKEGPGFEAVFAVAGLLAVAYLLRRRQ
ncbi:PGF-CTERM sorting domain-containing protein [Geoglobus ahangari]